MKKLLILFLMSMLMVSFVSSAILTTHDYVDEDLKVEFRTLGLIYLGEATLSSHSSVSEVRQVPYGKEEVVMWYDFNFNEDQIDGLGEFELIDMNTGEKLDREYTFVIWKNITVQEPTYRKVCGLKLLDSGYCYEEQTGTKEVIKEDWVDYNSTDIPKNSRIGIKVYVEKGDYIDGILTIVDEKITKHASWQASYEVGMVAWWSFEGDYNDYTTNWDGTATGNASVIKPGILGTALELDGSTGWVDITGSQDAMRGDRPFSGCAWVNMHTLPAAEDSIFSTADAGPSNGWGWRTEDGRMDLVKYSVAAQFQAYPGGNLNIDTWYHMCFIQDTTKVQYFLDGVNFANNSNAAAILDSNTDLRIGGAVAGPAPFHGKIDEASFYNRSLTASEIVDFYNGGAGIKPSIYVPTTPNITLVYPENTTYTEVINHINYTTAGGDNCWYSTDGGGTNTTMTCGDNVTGLTSNEGSNTWMVGTNLTGNNTNQSYVTFFVDSINPVLNITYPLNDSTVSVVVGEAFADIYLNWTSIDTNLQTCWYNNQTANITVACGTNATFNLPYGTYTHAVYANDSLGNINSAFATATYDFLIRENSQTFTSVVVEGGLEDFVLNLTISPSIEISSATLIYNNTNVSTATIDSIGQDRIIEVEDLQIPDFASDTSVNFYWEMLLSDSSYVNSTTQVQNVTTISLDDCSGYSFKLFNISLYDEEVKTPLLGTIELFYEIQNKPAYTTIQSISTKVENVSNTNICSDINLTGQNLAYSLEVRYFADDYATELYHIQKTDITAEIQALELYDLLLNDTTEFLVEYQNQDLVSVEGAVIQLLRKYISEDVYEVVEAPLTGNDGTAIVHIDLNTNKYKAIVVKDGVTLDVFNNIVFNCENELSGICNQELFAELNPGTNIPIENLQDFSYSITEDNNRSVVITYSIPSGVPSSVNVQLSQTDQFGNTTLCNKTVISSAGSIECTYDRTIGDSYLDLRITKDLEPLVTKSYIVYEEDLDLLSNNYIFVLIFLLSLAGMALTSPEWIIMNGVLTFVISGALWLIKGLDFVVGLGLIIWLVIASMILITKLAKQEDQ